MKPMRCWYTQVQDAMSTLRKQRSLLSSPISYSSNGNPVPNHVTIRCSAYSGGCTGRDRATWKACPAEHPASRIYSTEVVIEARPLPGYLRTREKSVSHHVRSSRELVEDNQKPTYATGTEALTAACYARYPFMSEAVAVRLESYTCDQRSTRVP